MSVKLLTEHYLEFLSLKGGCTGSSESTLVKMPHCWKSHVTAQIQTQSTHPSLCMLGIFSCLLSSNDYLQNQLFSDFFFRNTIRVNSFDPELAQHFVGHDLDPNCLQRLLAEDTSRPSVNVAAMGRTLVKSGSAYRKFNFLISQPKHMLWVLKRTISMRRFF